MTTADQKLPDKVTYKICYFVINKNQIFSLNTSNFLRNKNPNEEV